MLPVEPAPYLTASDDTRATQSASTPLGISMGRINNADETKDFTWGRIPGLRVSGVLPAKGAPAPGDTAVLTPAGTPSHHHEQHIGEQHRYTNVNVKRKNIAVFPGDEDTMAVLKYAEEAAQGADPHELVRIYREMLRNRLGHRGSAEYVSGLAQ